MSLAHFISFIARYEIGDVSAQSRIKRNLSSLRSPRPGEDEKIPDTQGELFTYQKQFSEIVLGTDRIMNVQQPGTGKTCAFIAAAEAVKATKSDVYGGVIICAKNEGILGDIARQAVYKCTPPGTYTPKPSKSRRGGGRKQQISTKDIIESLRPWYEFITHDGLLKIVDDAEDLGRGRGGSADRVIMSSFERRVLIIDEAHNFVEGKIPRMEKVIRISDLLEDKMKIVLVTATPMKEGPNDLKLFLRVMNPGRPLPEDNFSRIPFEKLKPFIDNVCTFVRASTTDTLVDYIGEQLGGEYKFIDLNGDDGEDVKADMIVYPTIMSEEQTNFYIDNFSNDSFFRLARTASSGCPIDSHWIRQNIKNAFPHSNWPYGPLPPLDSRETSFTPHQAVLEGLEALAVKSCKLGFAIRRAIESWGHVFMYSDDVEASLNGVNRIAELLTASGFERFTASMVATGASIPKRPRFCVLTSDVEESTIAVIKEIFNSRANVDGSLIKVFIASPKGKEAISVDGTTEAHILTASWLPSNDEQINARFVRATGHVLLREYLRDTLRRKNPRMSEEEIIVTALKMSVIRVFRHVARMGPLLPQRGRGQQRQRELKKGNDIIINIDDYMYHICTERNVSISRLMRMLKMTAIDCPLNIDRNVVHEGEDHSAACDFMTCRFTCSNDNDGTCPIAAAAAALVGGGRGEGSAGAASSDDGDNGVASGTPSSLHAVLPSSIPGLISSVEAHVMEILLTRGFVSVKEVIEDMSSHGVPQQIINIAISGMNGRIVRDRYGFPSQCEVKGIGISLVGGGSSVITGFTGSLGEEFNKGTVDLFFNEENEEELWRMFISMTHSQRNEVVETAAIILRNLIMEIIGEGESAIETPEEEIGEIAIDALSPPSVKMICSKMLRQDLFIWKDTIISTFMSTSTEFPQPHTEMKRTKMRILLPESDTFVDLTPTRAPEGFSIDYLRNLGERRLKKFMTREEESKTSAKRDKAVIMGTSSTTVPAGGGPIFFTRSYKLLR